MENFETLLEGSVKAHGHICPGQVIGVRMAMLGCSLVGFDIPVTMSQLKRLIVYVEMDRCAADAISFVTGVKLGRRSLKYIDNGIMAATFVNLETPKAFRILSTEESRTLVCRYAPEITHESRQQLEAYKRMDEQVLFKVEEVLVDVPACDMPGPTRFKTVCQNCGTTVRDKREVLKNNLILCRPCAFGTYFQPIKNKAKNNVQKSGIHAL